MADLTGKTLGRYRLVERLGRGGMAEVYKAYQPSMDRYVAIKVMHAYLAEDEGFVGRFQREAKVIANLRHPHIVQAYDFDVEEDVYYLVQEFITGRTLKDRLRQANERGEQIPLTETARVFTAICSAIEYAHRQGCIHRDIKPDNIMFDADGRPVLTDFGISAIVGGTRFTATGAMIGTPAYMSPEQGKGELNDPRSDIYSLGVVLYEMVTGQVPFDADTPFAVVLKHVNEALPMPSTIHPGLNPAVERVILKALAKDPEDRYQSALDLAQDLEEAVQEAETWALKAVPPPMEPGPAVSETVPPPIEPGPAVPEAVSLRMESGPATSPASTETERPAAAAEGKGKRRPWLWVLGGLAALLLINCCIIGLINAAKNRSQKAATPTATGPAPLSEGAAALIQSGFETLGADCTGDVEAAKLIFDEALDLDEDAAHAYVGLAQCSFCLGDAEAAMDNLDAAVELAPQDPLPYFWRGRLQLDEEEADEAYSDFSQAITLNPNYAEAYFWRAMVASWPLENNEQAIRDLDKAIELDPKLAPAYLKRGELALWHQNDPDRALADLTRYVELVPDDPQGYAVRGEVYLEGLQDYDRAAAEFTLAIERAPDETHLHERRGWVYIQQQQWEPAIQDYSRAIELGPTTELFVYRGMVLFFAGQYEPALADLEQAVAIGGDHAGAAYHGQGWVYAALGKYPEAIEAYTRASDYNWDAYSWPFFDESHWLLDRGIAYREAGQLEQALDDHNELLKMWEGWFRAHYERGLTYRAMGRMEEAQADFRQALEGADDPVWQERIMAEIERGQ